LDPCHLSGYAVGYTDMKCVHLTFLPDSARADSRTGRTSLPTEAASGGLCEAKSVKVETCTTLTDFRRQPPAIIRRRQQATIATCLVREHTPSCGVPAKTPTISPAD
jgi:hypothetical protein